MLALGSRSGAERALEDLTPLDSALAEELAARISRSDGK